MNKEQFKPEDIKLWDKKIKVLYSLDSEKNILSPFAGCLDIENLTAVKIPTLMFGKLVKWRFPRYNHLLPYKVKVVYLPEGEYTYWTEHTGYVGIHNDDGTLTINLKKDQEHSQLSMLWLLLHEFRQKIQFATPSIKSNLYNVNFDHFMDYLKKKGNSENDINHIFHEIMPYEIDANIFACELLDIEYPSSKFAINDYTIGLLK